MKDHIGEDAARQCHYAGDSCHQDRSVIYAKAQFVHVAGPEIAGQRDAYASRAAVRESEDQELDGRCGADGTQGQRAKETGDDCGVRKAVCLLKQVAEQEWQRECQNEIQGTSFRHIFHGSLKLPPFKIKFFLLVFDFRVSFFWKSRVYYNRKFEKEKRKNTANDTY